jgi:ATP-binding cassette subfamily C protein
MTSREKSNSVAVYLRLFVQDFAKFAGVRGLRAFVFVLLGTIVEGMGLVLFIPFLSVVIESKNTDGSVHDIGTRIFALFSVESRFAKLSALVVVFAVLMIARAIIISIRDITITELEIGFIQETRSRMARRLAAARWDTISRLRHSRIVHAMGAGIQQLDSATYILLHSAVAIIMLGGQIVLAFVLAPALAALALGVVLLGAAALMPMVRQARWIGRVITDANVSLIDDVSKFLAALKFAVSQNLQESFTYRFETTLDGLRAEQMRYVRQLTISRLTVATGSGLVAAVFILLGVVVFDISASVLITLLLILSRMSGPAMQLQLQAQQIANSLPAYERIKNLERDLAVAGGGATAARSNSIVTRPNGPIRFNKVSFFHDSADGSGSAGGVCDLELIIEPGSIVGITGPSGAGKTTFADLLLGLYPPHSGDVLVGGVVLDGALAMAWRTLVSYVPQDPFLFHDTIRQNLLWANPDANEASLWDVLRTVDAEEIVRGSPHGLDTVVGERGSRLSGGERQRLCLARALLRRPYLLVLDEATNAIDVEGERVLFERLLGATPHPTIVVIAHRMESLSYCQRVIVFERGRLISDRHDPYQTVDLASYHRAGGSPS